MKVWITKYALSQGIFEVEGEVSAYSEGRMLAVPNPERFGGETCYHGEDWHKTKEEAVARAEAMRAAKIASLKKSIARLEKRVFT